MSDGKKTLKIVLIGCGGALVLGCIITAGAMFLCGSSLMAPVTATQSFLADVRAGNYDAARQRMSGDYQSSHDVDAFRAAVQDLPALAQHTDASISGTQVNAGQGATIRGSLTTADGSIPFTAELSESGGHYYIDSITIQGAMLR